MNKKLIQLFIMLSIAINLTGCPLLLLGGGAAGGYIVAKDKRTIGQITDDATITTKINAKYIQDDLVKTFDINVDSYEGVVTLKGSVPSQAAKERAIHLAKETNGVKKVVSKLAIVTYS